MLYYHVFSGRGWLCVGGADRIPFLQGLVSNDVTRLAAQGLMYATLLSPQGKFLHDFFLMEDGETIWLETDAARLPELQKRFLQYKLRSKVTVEILPPPFAVAAVWGGEAPALPGLFADPRLPALGYRWLADARAIESAAAQHAMTRVDAPAYCRHRIALGVPEGDDMIADKSLLLEYGIDRLHGVDFSKGCYVGQEVTARSKYRGHLHKRLYVVGSDGEDLPARGTPVIHDHKDIGELRASCGDKGLALLRVEDVEKAGPLVCGGVALTSCLPQTG